MFSFLKEWFSGLMEGIEKLNDSTWPKVLEMTGRACAKVHSVKLFNQIWKDSTDFVDFLSLINLAMGEVVYKQIDDHTLTATYSECKCPLVKSGLVDSPVICECSPNWLLQNFEEILDTTVSIKTEKTILRGSENCVFVISH
ncbi:MAG: hypothetical protein ACW98I_09970 [Candidatus Hodarchaeales archaeon]|jgi:hypothetical protein